SDVGEFRLPVSPTQHVFLCGRTGSGKTTALLRLKEEYLRLGIPFTTIEHHGHATNDLLAMMAAGPHTRKAILLEPWANPVNGWNPIETNGESPYPIVQELIAIFHRRLWPDAWGPRLEEILRNTLLALAEAHLTLLEIAPFLSRPEFRRAVLRDVTIPEVREFWAVRFEHLSPSQRSLATEAVLNKMSVFHDPALKYVVGQAHGTLDIDAMLKDGESLIADFSSGKLRGNNYLLAALLVAKLKSAVYRRSENAKPHGLFLDEFQEMLSLEAIDDYLRSFRKFRCPVYLATQTLQIDPAIKSAIFGNCGVFCAFATSATDAAFLGREFGGREGDLVAGLLPDLPTGTAIAKIRGAPARLLRVRLPETKTTGALAEAEWQACVALGRTHREIDLEIEERTARLLTNTPIPLRTAAKTKHEDVNASQVPEGYDRP
ncbi:MAG: hypothetical protein KGM47_08655, partial [Acidobacteriota bacterium]|nr:hypothetical protein [Acidobacteriota bacterium]